MKPSSESTKLEGAKGFVEYVGTGKLKGKKAFITGGESVLIHQFMNPDYLHQTNRYSSGIGRAIAVQFAREGADVSIVYLPEEEDDAQDTKKMVEKEGKKCLLVPGNLMDNETCKAAVQRHVAELVVYSCFYICHLS
jgi:NAD(P)-dependent dehydrogenase (short-subunit alcohol dehydrogenase family)